MGFQEKLRRLPRSLQVLSVAFVMEPGGGPLDTCPATSGRRSTEGLERKAPGSGGFQKAGKQLLRVPDRVSNKELDFSAMHPCSVELIINDQRGL